MASDGSEYVFRILGPVQVQVAAQPVAFPRRQQRDLLALLLLRADYVISVGHLVDAMWGEKVPRTADTQIKNMVSGLRAALSSGPQPLATIDWQPAGYRLRVRRGQLDLAGFSSLVGQARSASPARAVHLLREAIGLWHGSQALAGVRASFARDARCYLDEKRTDALEALFTAELSCHHHTEIIAELTEAVALHPTRERLVVQLMTALHRSGRTSDALDTFQRARRVLVESYGLEPSPRLRDLERRILLADPSLDTLTPPVGRLAGSDQIVHASSPSGALPDHPQAAGTAAVDRPTVPAQLPMDVRGFSGRAGEIADLDRLLDDVGGPRTVILAVLMGSAGVGKTALAIHWAHRVARRFHDGQLYVNLRGFDPEAEPVTPSEALCGFLEALAVPPHHVPASPVAQAALFRSVVAGRRLLIVLDNAVSAEQVRPLLPGTDGCMVLVTSRNRLTGLVVVEGAHPVTVGLLTDVEARELLAARLGAHRVDAQDGAVASIIVACARLPLALAMVAARAAIQPDASLSMLAAELDDANPLDSLDAMDISGARANARTVFSWSYQRLSRQAAGLFRRLGLHLGAQVSTAAAASLLGCPVPAARDLLAELAYCHLLEEYGPGRFGLHDLMRAYAAELCAVTDPPTVRRTAIGRLLDHYLYTSDAAAGLLHPHRYRIALPPLDPDVSVTTIADREQALAWFTGEHRVLVEAVEQAAAADLSEHAWRIATAMGVFIDRQGRWDDWIRALRTALATACRLADVVGQAHAHSGLGLAGSRMRRYAEAHDHLNKALVLFGGLGDILGLAYTHLRLCAVCEGIGQPELSLDHARRAHDLFAVVRHDVGRAQALNNLGWYRAQSGGLREAADDCEASVALHRDLGDRQGAAHALDSLGYVYHRLGEFSRASTHYTESARILSETGDRSHAGFALVHLGDARDAAGDRDGARKAWTSALSIFGELRHPEADQVAAKLRGLFR